MVEEEVLLVLEMVLMEVQAAEVLDQVVQRVQVTLQVQLLLKEMMVVLEEIIHLI